MTYNDFRYKLYFIIYRLNYNILIIEISSKITYIVKQNFIINAKTYNYHPHSSTIFRMPK